ncbi:MAG: hypothetical protein QM760_00650 [Nibricoccus sp.]
MSASITLSIVNPLEESPQFEAGATGVTQDAPAKFSENEKPAPLKSAGFFLDERAAKDDSD